MLALKGISHQGDENRAGTTREVFGILDISATDLDGGLDCSLSENDRAPPYRWRGGGLHGSRRGGRCGRRAGCAGEGCRFPSHLLHPNHRRCGGLVREHPGRLNHGGDFRTDPLGQALPQRRSRIRKGRRLRVRLHATHSGVSDLARGVNRRPCLIDNAERQTTPHELPDVLKDP